LSAALLLVSQIKILAYLWLQLPQFQVWPR
jgi:hypothetical protein